MRRYRNMTFASKVRFWVITLAILTGIAFLSAITYSVFRGDGIKAHGEAFGHKGGIEIGKASK